MSSQGGTRWSQLVYSVVTRRKGGDKGTSRIGLSTVGLPHRCEAIDIDVYSHVSIAFGPWPPST